MKNQNLKSKFDQLGKSENKDFENLSDTFNAQVRGGNANIEDDSDQNQSGCNGSGCNSIAC